MAFTCVRAPAPDATLTCPGNDDGKTCGSNCDNTTQDPSIRLVNDRPSGSLPSDGFPAHRLGGARAPVDLATGLIDVSFSGLNQGAVGPGIQMRWSNGMKSGSSFTDIQTGVGINWSLNLHARLMHLGSDRWVAFFQPTGKGIKFFFDKETDGSFTPIPYGGCDAELVSEGSFYVLLYEGIKYYFYQAGGGLKKIVWSSRLVSEFIYDTDDRLEEVRTERTEGSNYYFNSLVLAYTASGGGGGPGGPGGASVPGIRTSVSTIVESITERSYVGTNSSPSDSDFTPMSRIALEIPDSAVSGRCPAGSLYRVEYQSPTVSGGTTTWSTDRTEMYIYATSATSDFYVGPTRTRQPMLS